MKPEESWIRFLANLLSRILLALVFIAVFLSRPILGEDTISYSVQRDEQGQFWLRVQNHSAQVVVIESFSLVLINGAGQVVDQREVPCECNCMLAPFNSGRFGPFVPPPNAVDLYVRIKYSIAATAKNEAGAAELQR